MEDRELRSAGFSLVEMIIVIAIMAVLIGVLAPQYVKYVEKSRVSRDEHVADSLSSMAHVLTVDEEFYTKVNEGDVIRFDQSGISTNNDSIRDTALDEYISGWQEVKVASNTYKDMCYEIEFVSYEGQYRLAVINGWHPNS